MSSDSSSTAEFDSLIRRVRRGDQAAARDLVQLYEPAVRRAVRFRLTDSRLRTALDSLDICQSVLGSFFVRAAAGEYEIDQPEQLINLLVTMANNRVASRARRENAQKRDRRRLAAGADPGLCPSPEPTPSQQIAAHDLLQAIRDRLTPAERRLMELRSQGHDWQAIAILLEENAAALRKRLSRALDRVSQELHLDDADE